MKKLLLFIAAGTLYLAGFSQNYFTVSPQSPDVFEVELSTGITTSNTTITSSAGNISGYGGLTEHPTSGDIYAVAKVSGGQRVLGILDLTANTLSSTVNLVDKISGITFDNQGNCYGITGDGADVPSTLYQIDTSTGVATMLIDLSAVGSDGEAIAFNSSDGKIYRYAGNDAWQTIDISDWSTEEFTMSSEPENYGQALYYEAGNNTFTLAAGDMIHSVSTSGVISASISATIGDDDGFKGILLDPSVVNVDETEAVSVLVYPNPSNGSFTISFDLGVKSLAVYSFDGREVLSLTAPESEQVKLDLSSGNYFLKLETLNGELKIEKLMVY